MSLLEKHGRAATERIIGNFDYKYRGQIDALKLNWMADGIRWSTMVLPIIEHEKLDPVLNEVFTEFGRFAFPQPTDFWEIENGVETIEAYAGAMLAHQTGDACDEVTDVWADFKCAKLLG